MEQFIPTSIEDTSLEVLARIVKSTSQQYGCSVRINYSDGRREATFIGDDELKPHIAAEVKQIFHVRRR